ncbi:hypothetical protein J421_0906 [Gemmatirosa kalamazoonensis]|uniref:Zinc-finger domain-containing protein n=1 Tax=Gemmatirosa kalamazoonensis TaxID=861299 RepID=W0RGC1_9BACT|nr:zf-HC2 domain-containing protein [Gemmatirosa kalamazoonensis]AHG88443.1 hypothetical protein J421_0906 [Gemmatirosa kalamazoonensis]
MDCRSFRKHHVAFLDDLLPGELLVAAERHVRECAACAAHDTAVRRSLLLVRNLPSIELSDDFSARLAARLDDVRCGRCVVPDDVPADWAPSRAELLRTAIASPVARKRLAAVAAGLLALTYAGDRWYQLHRDGDVELPPVIATMPETPPMLVPPMLVTSASTGIPVWPAALLADQTPTNMVDAQLMVASW